MKYIVAIDIGGTTFNTGIFTQSLKKIAISNKDKVARYGASYGGYATLAGLAFTPDLYACGVDYVGVSNISSLSEITNLCPAVDIFNPKSLEEIILLMIY